MMHRFKIAPSYTKDYLEIERPQPLSDNLIEETIQRVLCGEIDKDISDAIYDKFKLNMTAWLARSNLNNLKGLESFTHLDIMNGCTQFIDNLYMDGPVQVLRKDYRYHERLGLAFVKDVGSLIQELPLVIAMPFPSIGAAHPDMDEILYECKIKRIPVHIDGAWISCCRDINFNFDNEVIRSVGISLSKGLGLGWNRIGLRWTKDKVIDSISIMNNFNMNIKATAMIGNHFLSNFEPDYLWNMHGDNYYKLCRDFSLSPTTAIHIAMQDGRPVGVSPLLRYLENAN